MSKRNRGREDPGGKQLAEMFEFRNQIEVGQLAWLSQQISIHF